MTNICDRAKSTLGKTVELDQGTQTVFIESHSMHNDTDERASKTPYYQPHSIAKPYFSFFVPFPVFLISPQSRLQDPFATGKATCMCTNTPNEQKPKNTSHLSRCRTV